MFVTAQGQIIEYSLNLHPDTIKSRTSAIKKIVQSDSINIMVHLNGCFEFDSVQYIIQKKQDRYSLDYQTQKNRNFQRKTINADNLKKIEELFIHALNIDWGGCTSSRDFSIGTTNSQTYFSDDRCAGNDDIFKRLLEILNLKYYP